MKIKLRLIFLLLLWKTSAYGYEWEEEIRKDSLLPLANVKIVNAIHTSELEWKFRKAYPTIPSVYEMHLPKEEPLRISKDLFYRKVGPGSSSLIVEEARYLSLFEDFKTLADLRRRLISYEEWKDIVQQAQMSVQAQCEETRSCNDRQRRALFIKSYINKAYDFEPNLIGVTHTDALPRWKLDTKDKNLADAFAYTESHWTQLLRHHTKIILGSLLPSPYPFVMPAGRFKESYYWDTYFGVEGLLATERLTLAQMQAENFLYDLRHYGKIPNGRREYYLTRSHPPFSSTLIRRVLEETLACPSSNEEPERARILTWLEKRAFPLLEKELVDFWMNPRTRYDTTTGLHHHWDELNLPRPERHSTDDEEALGLHYRDVRAIAETGLDFTAAFKGKSGKNEASDVANVMLNSMIYKFMKDLAWMADLLKDKPKAEAYERMASEKSAAIQKYLWTEHGGYFESYHLRNKERLPVLTANTFVPLFVGLATPSQAERVRATLAKLEFEGGIGASELFASHHQWDGSNGWAPQHMMIIQGLLNYGYSDDAERIAQKWVKSNTEVYRQEGAFFERIDIKKIAKPKDDHRKYPVQEGFLWTNASYVWALFKILGYQKLPL